MGKVVSCEECRKAYRNLEALEDLRDNDGICLVCNNPIEVEDWDRVLASYDDENFDDEPDEVDEDDFGEDVEADLDDDDLEDDFGGGIGGGIGGEMDADGEFLDDDEEADDEEGRVD